MSMTKSIILIFLCVFTENLGFQCPENGNFPDPASCSRYFECVDGQATRQVCPQGLLYNKNARECFESGTVTCSSTASRSASYKIVCYFTNWAGYREKDAKFIPSQIDPFLCTHINYAFASLDADSQTIQLGDPDVDEGYYKDIMELKKRNPNLKVMISLGGYTDSSGTKYSDLAARGTARKNFNSNAVKFLKKYGFDGLDFDWEYPGCYQGECVDKSNDRENFAAWIKELRALFDEQSPRFLLSAAVSPVAYYFDKAYDVPSLASALDFINVMGYDYTNSANDVTGQNAPLNASPGMDPNLTVAAAMMNWQKKGAPASKLNLGFPAYGVSFTLKNSESHSFGSPALGPGLEGPGTKYQGELAYYEICQKLKDGWNKGGDDNAGPFAYSGDQWVGYDDPNAVARKAQFIVDHGYGGAMIFDISMDDFNGGCCGIKYPLMSVVNNVLNGNGKTLSDVKCQ